MKIPSIFVPEKNLEYDKRLKSKDLTGKILLQSCEEFMRKTSQMWMFQQMYEEAESMVQKISCTKKDVEDISIVIDKVFLQELENKLDKRCYEFTVRDLYFYFPNIGIYLSALTNKIITDYEKITLSPGYPLTGLGTSLERGTLIIESKTGSHAGFMIKGGKLVLKKDTGEYLGAMGEEGEIRIETQSFLLSKITPDCKATIYHKNKRIHP